MDVAPVLSGIAFVVFVAAGVALCIIDARTHRLPNAIVLPVWAVCAVLLAGASAAGAGWGAFGRAALGSAVLFLVFLVLRLAGPRGVGGGDVKLAGLVGLLLAWIGWETLLVGVAASFVLGGLFALILVVLRRADRRTQIAFGPWMLAGAWFAIGAALVTAR